MRLREIKYFSMPLGLSNLFHLSLLREEGILFQDMELSVDISTYLMPLVLR